MSAWHTPHRPACNISDDSPSESAGGHRPLNSNPSDFELLDAYSQAVVGVVDRVSPAVISLSGEGRGSGSGFLISSDGYAITNSHVVGSRRLLKAQTSDGDVLDAKVVGDDPATDLALLQVAARDLPFIELGDSEAIRIGQLVIALGSPLGLHSTVSSGIVSANGRSLRGQDGRLIEDVIQHTAPINPGNSGGPLVDSRGRVVGVNTAIIAMAQSLGFAIPSSTAKWIVSEILAYGSVQRRQLGIAASTIRLPRSLTRRLDLLNDSAVEVSEVNSNSIAVKAGLLPGDVIVTLNDRLVTSVDDIHRLLSIWHDQSSLTFGIVRGERLIEVIVEQTP